MRFFPILARRGNEELNQWLEQNPLVLGGIALGIGVLLAGWGAYELSTGTARDKYGNRVEGGMGMMLAGVRVLFGLAACGFGIYKMVA